MKPIEVAKALLSVVTAPEKALITQVVVAVKTRPFIVQEIVSV